MPEDIDGARLLAGQRMGVAARSSRSMRSASETAETLYKTPGLVSHRVRCGKPICRCTTGEGHGPYWFLYWREGTVQRRRYVSAVELPAVRAVVEGRRMTDQAERLVLGQSLETWRGIRRWLRDLENADRR